MATDPAAGTATASTPPDDKPPNSVEPLPPAMDANPAATSETFTPSVFVNSEPIREEQIQNAMKFLSHPKVRGSPVIYRRSFLEKKGLTKEEIDEAFRRVPDPVSTGASAQPTSTNQEAQLKPATNYQVQAPTQSMQPGAPAGTMVKTGPLHQYKFHWSHAFLAIGLLAASGAGTALLIKKTIIPRLKSWIRKVVLEEEDDMGEKTKLKPSLAEEAAAAAKAAAAAAVDAAKASQEMLSRKNTEKNYFEEFSTLLGVQVQEMKSMSNAIRKLEGQSSYTGRLPVYEQDDYRGPVPSVKPKPPNVNGNMDGYAPSVRSSSPPTSVDSSMPAAHPKSYMDIMAMVQRGEKPANIRDINDMPPNPNQQVSNPRLEPKTKPWEVDQSPYSSGQVLRSQTSSDNGLITPTNDDIQSAWRQQKNPRITEIETEDQPNPRSYTPPPKRTWVPPQPPPVVMPEAAAAIRQPKSSSRKEQTPTVPLSSQSSDGIDELQMIQKISESGGAVEINGGSGSSQMISSEIQEEEY